MHEPLTEKDLATFARLREEAKLPEDTGHSQACGCEACNAVWGRAWKLQQARGQLAELDAVGRLLAEVRRLQGELAADRAAVGALVGSLIRCDGSYECDEPATRLVWDVERQRNAYLCERHQIDGCEEMYLGAPLRARLGKAAEAIEEPVRATVEWMRHEGRGDASTASGIALGFGVSVDSIHDPMPNPLLPDCGDRMPTGEEPPTRREPSCRPLPPEPDDEPSRYDAEVAERMAR
ncbi:hypothetical protein [Sorangium sp. So ce388]|uniref:hypothetical protein n=1 Tax=Sorangium sp. So ce388 TaxID=3133309 RepID=UPI003F5C0933